MLGSSDISRAEFNGCYWNTEQWLLKDSWNESELLAMDTGGAAVSIRLEN